MNKQTWNRLAPLYERAMRPDNATYQTMYTRVADRIAGKDVLELATGPGLLARHVAHAAHTMIATDYAPGMIAQARRASCPPNLTFAVADATALPYAANTFDVVVIANALHVMPQPAQALREIDRVLKDGGLLIAPNFVAHRGSPLSRLWTKLLRLAGVQFAHQWQAAEYCAFLAENGWQATVCDVLPGRVPLAYTECIRARTSNG